MHWKPSGRAPGDGTGPRRGDGRREGRPDGSGRVAMIPERGPRDCPAELFSRRQRRPRSPGVWGVQRLRWRCHRRPVTRHCTPRHGTRIEAYGIPGCRTGCARAKGEVGRASSNPVPQIEMSRGLGALETGGLDMSHAVVLRVKLPDGDDEASKRTLTEQAIPQAKAQSGFQKGSWMRSADNIALGVVVFDTEENATEAASVLRPPTGGGALISSTVYEVRAEARCRVRRQQPLACGSARRRSR